MEDTTFDDEDVRYSLQPSATGIDARLVSVGAGQGIPVRVVSDALAVPQPATRAEERASRGMGFGQSLATALEALNANRLRFLFTMLGTVIGVGTVIVMVALGGGARASVAQRLQGLGTNLLKISPTSARAFGGVWTGAGTAPTLNESFSVGGRRSHGWTVARDKPPSRL